ncbi:MAG: type 4a pilus biogenesis protein PilO [Geobacteraceae bacterium]
MDPQLEKIMKLPNKQKLALLVVIALLEVAAFFFGLQQPKMKQLKDFQGKLDSLKTQIQETKKIADNLPKFKNDYEKLNMELVSALTELPNQKEIPTLLTGITSIGKGAGLDFLSFKPRAEEPKDFYAAVPVDIVVSGSFHNVAGFFVAVGNMPRIVNINNVVFSDIKNVDGRTLLKVSCLATTFRFLDKKETKNEKPK